MRESNRCFDSAIDVLILGQRTCPECQRQIYAAVNFLKKAMLVEKSVVLTALIATDSETDVWRERGDEFEQIQSLLDALPDA